MTADLPPFDDDTLSAYVDGLLDAETAAQIERDPQARRRAEALARAAASIGALPTAPPRAHVDAAVAAALVATTPVRGGRRIRSTATRERAPWLRWTLPALAAAAAIVVVVGVAGVVTDRREEHPEAAGAPTTTVVQQDAAEAFATGEPRADAGAVEGDEGAGGPQSALLPDLGPVADGAALRQRIDAASVQWDQAQPAPRCAAEARAAADVTVAPVATLAWQGSPAVLWSSDPGSPPATLLVVGDDGCEVLARIEGPPGEQGRGG